MHWRKGLPCLDLRVVLLDLSRAHDCEPGPARCWAQYALDAHSYLCLHVCKSCGHLKISHFALPLALPSLTHSPSPSPSPGHLTNMDQTLHPNAHPVISIYNCTRSLTPMTIFNLTRTLTLTATLTLALTPTNTDLLSH